MEFWCPLLLGQVVHICLIVLALLRDYVARILILLLVVVLKVVLVLLWNDTLEVQQLGVIEVILIMEIARVDSILLRVIVFAVLSFLNNGVKVSVSRRTLFFAVHIMQRSVKLFL